MVDSLTLSLEADRITHTHADTPSCHGSCFYFIDVQLRIILSTKALSRIRPEGLRRYSSFCFLLLYQPTLAHHMSSRVSARICLYAQ